jgi:hypothetical protein
VLYTPRDLVKIIIRKTGRRGAAARFSHLNTQCLIQLKKASGIPCHFRMNRIIKRLGCVPRLWQRHLKDSSTKRVSLVARFVGAKRPSSWIVCVNVLLQTKRTTFVFFHLEHTSVVLMLGEGIFGLLHLVIVLVLCIGVIVPLGRLVAEDDTARQVTVDIVGLV